MSDSSVPHFSALTPQWEPLPEYNGHQAVLYRSEDGRRIAATFRESGTFTFEYPADEFVYVIAGTARAAVRGGDVIDLGPGDAAYFREGQVVDFTMSDDFHDITCLISDTPITY